MTVKHALISMVALFSIGSAQATTDKISPVNNMPNAFTADSQRIVFQSWAKRHTGKYGNQMFSMKLDGSDVRREIVAGDDMGWPEFTRDGKRVALFAKVGGNYDVLVIDLAQANHLSQFSAIKRITNHVEADFFVSWSPKEDKLAFYTHRDEPAQIYVMNDDGTNIKNLSNNKARESDPDWSIQDQITFQSNVAGNEDVWVMNGDGSHRKNLTKHKATDHFGDWSPDGEFIVFSSDRDGDEDLYIMRKDGSDVRQLTNGEGVDHWPLWSPDGKTITFARVINEWGTVYTIKPDGTGETSLTERRSYHQF